MGTWYNSDGLFLKMGVDEGTASKGGEFFTAGAKRINEYKITLTDLSTSAQVVIHDTAPVPKNARIEEVEVEVETAATSGGSATLDVGLVRSDARATSPTELDYDGFVAAAALATINTAGKRLNLINGSTAAGALIGTTLSNFGYVVAKAGTAVFTAGVLKVRVHYSFL